MKVSVNIEVSDEVRATDKLGTLKDWFNGVKKFVMVKVAPAKRK